MRFASASEHRDFFNKHRYIEFEELLTSEEAALLVQKGKELLAKRLKTTSEKISNKTPQELFMQGRDLWREDPLFKKIALRSQFAEIAASLFNQPALRIAYDQLFYTGWTKGINPESPFHQAHTLQQLSCFKKVVGGLLLQLSPSPTSLPAEPFCPYPQKCGNGIFFKGELPITLAPLFGLPDTELFLIVYCQEKTLYLLEPRDLHTHALKKEGYAFGDQLKNTTHPLVYKK